MMIAGRAEAWVPSTSLWGIVALGGSLAAATAMAAAPGWSGLMTGLWALAAVTFRRVPVAGLAGVLLAIPFEQQGWISTLAGDLTASQFLAWALVAGTSPEIVARLRDCVDPLVVGYLMVIVALVASVAAGDVQLSAWLQEVAHWVLPLLVYLATRAGVRRDRDGALVVGGIAASVVLTSLVAFKQAVSGVGPESFAVDGMLRVFGTFRHPNTLGAFLAIALPPVIVLAMVRCGWMSWLARVASVTGIVAMALTQSRGGWLALASAIAVLILVAPRYVQRRVVVTAAVLLVMVAATGVAGSLPGTERFASVAGIGADRVQVTTETWGQLEREAHWKAAWSMMTSEPQFGVGAANFNDHFREHTSEWRFRIGRGHAHNAALNMGAQAGVPGIVAYLVWIVAILAALGRRVASATGTAYLFAAGALASSVAVAVDGVFESFDVASVLLLVAIVVAIGLGGNRQLSPVRPVPGTGFAA